MSKRKRWQKRQQFFLLVTVALVTVISGSFAWYVHTQRIQTATRINMPKVYIEGPDGSVLDMIELGDIDVTSGTKREYVFRIVTAPDNRYRLQLAYTTNIPFTYEIYPVSTKETDYSVVEAGNTYYYDIQRRLGGNDLQKEATHEVTYAPSANKVQYNAEPQYWQSDSVTQEEEYTYFVLRISWTEGLINNKETDMVYMTVKLV